MRKVIVSSDSTSDLDMLFDERNIPTVPLTVILGDRQGFDGVEVTPSDIYAYFDATKTTPKTAAVPPEQYKEFFRRLTADGSEVVHFTISSDMSACYNNAVKAAEEFSGVYVVDSHNLSTGIGLQVLYADDLAAQGLSGEEVFGKVEARKTRVQASFVVDTMDFLYRGGRCGGVAKFFASVLKLHPSIFVDPVSGKMVVGKKYMGATEKAILKYVQDTLASFDNPDPKYFFITHSSSPASTVAKVREEVRAAFPEAHIFETVAGSTVTSHCGKGTLGILYYNDGGNV